MPPEGHRTASLSLSSFVTAAGFGILTQVVTGVTFDMNPKTFTLQKLFDMQVRTSCSPSLHRLFSHLHRLFNLISHRGSWIGSKSK